MCIIALIICVIQEIKTHCYVTDVLHALSHFSLHRRKCSFYTPKDKYRSK